MAVPCATVLLRIRPAARSADMLDVLISEEHPQEQWEQLGIQVPAPAYGLAKYDSTRCEPSSIERKLYNFHSHDDDILIGDALEDVRTTYSLCRTTQAERERPLTKWNATTTAGCRC